MIIGIDLGTTNSAVGIWRDGRAELIPNSLGSLLTPSAVSIDEKGNLLVGLAARERQVTHPALTATTFKRYMGSKRKTRLGKQDFLPEELSALVLRSLKADAGKFAKAVRGHWGVENGLHWVLDVVFGEDQSRARTGHAAENLAATRRLAVSLLRRDNTCRRSIKGKLVRAAIDADYLKLILKT